MKNLHINGTVKIIIAIIAVILAIVIAFLAIWMITVEGKESTDYWCSTMKYSDDYAVSMKKAQCKDFKILALSDPNLMMPWIALE